ncbi:MAG TPA: hypothetical protein PLC90_11775, partial [Bacteroidales bacterium]|nr:hypothetical protein [Bacteroidales bacterium]
MKKHRIILLAVIGLSLLLRIQHEITYQDMYVDKMVQIAAAKNLLMGNGFTFSTLNSNDFSVLSSTFVNKYAPGYSLLLIPLYYITGDFSFAVLIMDILFVILLFLALILLLKTLDIPPQRQILFFVFAGISFTPFYHLSSTDLMALTFFQWAVFVAVCFLKKKNHYLPLALLTGVLCFITGFMKFNYYPLMFAVPLGIFIIGFFDKTKKVLLFSILSGFTAAVLLATQSLLLKLFSGSMFFVGDPKGFFPENLAKFDVFPFKSLFFYEGALQVVFNVLPVLKPVYLFVAALFSLIIVFEILRYILRKIDAVKLTKDYLTLGITVLFVNVFFLIYMSLSHKGQSWEIPPWTPVEETRYYGQSMLFIEIVLLTMLLYNQYKSKILKALYVALLAVVLLYAGSYWINENYTVYVKNNRQNTYAGMYEEEL